ncbi:hypothetical protein VNO78_13362 [Psophocarpus tetragonolobus]|uniref:Disease resistance RPP13-like protein 1 n=1 Tax=Psophocarpus tetragonolobus TaxID=3891 RepID=A0AAN9SQA3_PSOTE
MAAELVGGALLSAFLQAAVDRLASGQLEDVFRARKLDKTLLSKLKVKLLSIDALADDAEQKQLKYPRVRDWLHEVKDVVLDAEDILDEIEHTKSQVEAENEPQTCTCKVPNFFNATFNSFNKKINKRMQQVLDKLEYLANLKGDLGLIEATNLGVGSCSKVSLKLPSTSLVVESVIYGRDDDKEKILNWLTSETGNPEQLSIFSIVGMGGMGKTTLAQHVYSDSRMEQADFDIKAWVCVSDDFDVLTLTRRILEAITKSRDDSGDLQMVHERLKEKVTKKKFLLVLDDVWNERREEWEAVQTPLCYGAPGSKIVVTTRSEEVATTMRSCKVHRLEQLQKDHCWQVFSKHAFQEDQPQLTAELKEIATKIVEKCKGLPLALKTIGSLLHMKATVGEWKNVLMSSIWDLTKEKDCAIVPALYLSYQHLPCPLKRCFAFCALFPQDYEFTKEDLILLWIAQNFLQCPQQSKSPEEVGDQYFHDLLSRSFFQRTTSTFDTCFVMHDLLNDLAKYVYGDMCFRLKVDKGKSMPKTTRHFSFIVEDVKYFDGFGSLTDAKKLRTFYPIRKSGSTVYCNYSWEFKISIHELFSKFKFLRFISLFDCFDLKEIPDSIGDLKHLHSLDLSCTGIQNLPDSICLLYNLLILKLNYCRNLEELPLNLHKLINLRSLQFRSTKVRKMPMHLGELKNLRDLSMFCLGKSKEYGINQIGGLNLHGHLSIEELQNIVNPLDAIGADLKNKTQLVSLELKWNLNHIPNDERKEKEVLENLQPSKQLKNLSITNYCGTEFPSWLFDNFSLNVVSLNLADCKYCLCLPPLGLLPYLERLEISGFDRIVSIGAEFYGSISSSFTSLKSLNFYHMKEWEEWECKLVFPRLEYLSLRQCPKLKCLPQQLLHLKKINIRDCGSLSISQHSVEASSLESIGHTVSDKSLEAFSICSSSNMNVLKSGCYDFLEDLEINDGCDSLKIFLLDFFPKLRSLQLTKCGNLQMISQEHPHNHLYRLSIIECGQFESFPNEGLFAPQLDSFFIKRLENLKLLPKCMDTLLPSLHCLWVEDCPQLEMLSNGRLPSNIFQGNFSGFKLISSMKGAFSANTSLEHLDVQNMDVDSFPDEGLLPLSLTYLAIKNCSNLKKLDYKGLCHLSSLESMVLENCPSLQCLPEEGLPKSISFLLIRRCPLLKQRCQKPEGEDWRKIACIEEVSECIEKLAQAKVKLGVLLMTT